jgi:hypothetical protein
MEKKKIRQNMASTGKYGTIVRSIKAQPRSPIPATATKQLTEIGIEIKGSFASEMHERGEVIGWRSDDNLTQAIIDNEEIVSNKYRQERMENYKRTLERSATGKETNTAQQHRHKNKHTHNTMHNGRQHKGSGRRTRGSVRCSGRCTRRGLLGWKTPAPLLSLS